MSEGNQPRLSRELMTGAAGEAVAELIGFVGMLVQAGVIDDSQKETLLDLLKKRRDHLVDSLPPLE